MIKLSSSEIQFLKQAFLSSRVSDEKKTIYFDMDGVLTDFDGKYKEYFGELPDETQERESTNKMFQNIVSKGEEFWSTMEENISGVELFNRFLENPSYEVKILSSPMTHKESKSGKIKWVKEHFPDFPEENIILDSNKGKYGDEKSILIDDRDDNLSAFSSNKGTSIYFEGKMDVDKVEEEILSKNSVTAYSDILLIRLASVGDDSLIEDETVFQKVFSKLFQLANQQYSSISPCLNRTWEQCTIKANDKYQLWFNDNNTKSTHIVTLPVETI